MTTETRLFLRVAVLTMYPSEDGGRHAACVLITRMTVLGHHLIAWADVPDDEAAREQVQQWIDTGEVDIILVVSGSAKDALPDVIVTSGSGMERPSTLMRHAELGPIGVINLRTPLARQAA